MEKGERGSTYHTRVKEVRGQIRYRYDNNICEMEEVSRALELGLLNSELL